MRGPPLPRRTSRMDAEKKAGPRRIAPAPRARRGCIRTRASGSVRKGTAAPELRVHRGADLRQCLSLARQLGCQLARAEAGEAVGAVAALEAGEQRVVLVAPLAVAVAV